MDIKQLANSLLGVINGTPNFGANVNDTPANAPQMQNIRNLGALNAQGTRAKQASQALGVGAGQQADNEDAQRKAAAEEAQAAEEEKRKELERLQDPNEYKQIINDKGGYDFFDPLGNKISPVEFARKRNVQLTDVYKKSQDPNDKDFLDDYDKVMQLGKIIQSGDKKARDKFYEKNPDYKKAYESTPFNEIVDDLHTEYPGYFRSNDEQKRKDIGKSRLKNVGGGGGNILQQLLSHLTGK